MGSICSCGGDFTDPLPIQPLFVVPLPELDEHLHPQFLILPSQYPYFHNNMEKGLRDRFPNLIVLRSRQQLQEYKLDGKNNILVIGCSNQDEAKEIRSLKNFHTFTQIGIAGNFNKDFIQTANKGSRLQLGFRFAGTMKFSSEDIIAFMEKANLGRTVYFCHKDHGHINRANLFFDFFFRRGEKQGLLHFFEWARRSGEKNEFVDRLQSMADKDEIGKLIVDNIFTGNQICLQAVDMLKQTRNPTILGHTAWLLSNLFNFIKVSYKKTMKRIKVANKFVFVVWIGLNKEEQESLLEQENFMFSTFIIASTNIDEPKPSDRPNLTLYKFFITLPYDIEEYSPEVDLGFYQNQGKVILNLQNWYRLDSVRRQTREIEATYCSVGNEYNLRTGEFRYTTFAKPPNIRMMISLDVYFLNRPYVRSQLDLVFLLQFYHLFKALLQDTLQKIATKKQVALSDRDSLASTVASIDKSLHPSKALRQKIGDCEVQLGNFIPAAENYNHIASKERYLFKKLHLYLTNDDRVEYRNAITELENYQKQPNTGYNSNFMSYVANYYKAVMNSRKEEIKISEEYAFINKSIVDFSNLYEAICPAKKVHKQSLAVFPLHYMLQKAKLNIAKRNQSVELSYCIAICEQAKIRLDGIHMVLLPE